MRNDAERRMAELEAEIARTRSDMDATLSAIEGRLTTGQLIDQGMDYLRHSSAQEFASNLGSSVKQNPLPVTLVGVGLAWLMVSGSSARRNGSGASHSAAAGDAGDTTGLGERAGDALHKVSDAAGSAINRLSGSAQSARQSLSQGTRSAVDSVSETAHSAQHKLSQAAASARERATRVREGARHQMERARGGYDYLLHEQPLALGAIGLALGALIAASLPRTRREDALMGEASDHLTDEAKALGREQLEKAQRVAQAAGSAASAEAERQGVNVRAGVNPGMQAERESGSQRFAAQPERTPTGNSMEDDWEPDPASPDIEALPDRDNEGAPLDSDTGMPPPREPRETWRGDGDKRWPR